MRRACFSPRSQCSVKDAVHCWQHTTLSPALDMTLDRRGFLSASASVLALGTAGLPMPAVEAEPETAEWLDVADLQIREITVYTTADNTDYRLSATDKLSFKPMGQSLESQVCVFLDPTKRAQTILGIGGALMDASAEVFAKLSEAKQRELLDAYFDR